MRSIGIIVLVVFLKNLACAQAHQWIWARAGLNTGKAVTNSVAYDKDGNSLAIGSYTGTVTFGTSTFTSLGTSNIYLVKYSSSGTLLWARNIQDSGIVNSSAIIADANGNIYIAGSFTRSAVFENTTVVSFGGEDVFVAKFKPDGTLSWVRTHGSPYRDGVFWGIGLDSRQNLITTGKFGGGGRNTTMLMDTFTLTSALGMNIFISKYDSSGKIIWAKQTGNTPDIIAYDLAIDKLDNIFIAGSFGSRAFFDHLEINSTNEGLVGGGAFLVKLDSSANAQWAKPVSARRPDLGISWGSMEGILLTLDSYGNPIFGGNYSGCDIKLEGLYLPPAESQYGIGTYDMWFAKYSSAGVFQWARVAGSIDPDYLWDISSDHSGNVYIAGECGEQCVFNSDTAFIPNQNTDRYSMFVCKYDQNGDVNWLQTNAGNRGTTTRGIAFDPSGEMLVGGGFAGSSLTLGTSRLTSGGIFNGFVGKMGSYLGIRSTTRSNNDILLFPNPVTDKLNFVLTEGSKFLNYQITNAIGRSVSCGVLDKQFHQSISLPYLPSGLYYLQMSGMNKTATKPFTIRN